MLLEGRKQAKYESGVLQGILLFKEKEEIIQSKIELTLEEYYDTKYALAIDNDFLVMKP